MRLSRSEALLAVQKLFEQTHRPILIGPTSIVLGYTWNLDETESLFDELLHEGKIRHLTEAEKNRFDCFFGYLRISGVTWDRAEPKTPPKETGTVSQIRATGRVPASGPGDEVRLARVVDLF